MTTQVFPIAWIVEAIAAALGVPKDEIRPTKDKARKRIMYAIKSGELTEFESPGSGLLFLPQVVDWARRKWPGFFQDHTAQVDASGKVTLLLTDTPTPTVIPGDLERCQQTLQSAYKTIEELYQELNNAHAEIRYLRPLAEKYEQIRAKNRRSAKLPRDGSA